MVRKGGERLGSCSFSHREGPLEASRSQPISPHFPSVVFGAQSDSLFINCAHGELT